ncbi:MAG: hypothetical protein O7A63_04230 [Acidobacteria bacterium]|nr:hypothetical protein [Acidobacteriota bacterium]
MRRSTGLGIVLLVVLAFAITAFLPTPAVADGDDAVVVSRPGVVFHKAGSGDIRGKGHEKSLSAALASGYHPCKVCFGRDISVDLRAAGAAGASTTSSSFGSSGFTPPGLSTPTISQPFGLRAQSHRTKGASGAIRDPFGACDTSIRFPGSEQGAYGS